MAEKAFITPEVLKWARETAKISIEEATLKIPACTKAKLISWECGDEYPTIRQAEKLAKIYRRPFSALFLPSIPQDFKTLRDFRSRNKNIYSTALVFMMREVQEKQAWLKELYQTENEQSVKFIGKFNQTVSSKIIAEDIRKTLRINSKEAQKDPLKYWIEKSENNRIFISQSSFYHTRLKLDVEEVKGFAIADSLVPFIFINSSDYKSSCLFTLVHELAHLWIKASGISSDIGIDFRDVSTYDPIEIFCNDIAACALMPENEIYEIINASEDFTYSIIEEVSLRFGVSNYAVIMRFLKLGKISIQQFEIFKKEASSRFFQYLELEAEKIKTGFANPYLLKLKRNGKMFAQIIFNFYKGGKISGSEASTLLNTKINHFPKFEQYVYQ